MEIIENNPESIGQTGEATPHRTRIVRFLKSFLILLMLSGLLGLSSCAVAVRNPRPQRHGFVIFNQSRSAQPVYKKHYKIKAQHDNGKHRGHNK